MNITKKGLFCIAAYFIVCGHIAYADTTIINNNNNNSNPTPQNNSSCNNNITTDPRVPPAGVYSTKNSDGSGQTTYTTGETKPYIVDNSCNNSPVIQPYVIQPTVPVR